MTEVTNLKHYIHPWQSLYCNGLFVICRFKFWFERSYFLFFKDQTINAPHFAMHKKAELKKKRRKINSQEVNGKNDLK